MFLSQKKSLVNYCNYSIKHDFSLDILTHSVNVAKIAVNIAEGLQLNNEEKAWLNEASLYHDIGKSKIPSCILYKKDKLSVEEWSKMMEHSCYSEDLYLNMGEKNNERIVIGKIIRYHHENWDGTGYPDGISRNEIPVLSRILRIADIFDAITQSRAYRPYKIENAIEIMEKMCDKEIDSYIFKNSYNLLHDLVQNNSKCITSKWKKETVFV